MKTAQKVEWRRRLLPFLDVQAAGKRIMIPSVVLAEYLYGLPQADWQAQSAAIIAGNFFVAPLSHQAAIKAAENRRKLVGKQHEKDVARGLGGNEVKFKADLLVAAIAMTFQATLLVTGDRGLCNASKQLGLHSMHCDDLPEPLSQASLPGMSS